MSIIKSSVLILISQKNVTLQLAVFSPRLSRKDQCFRHALIQMLLFSVFTSASEMNSTTKLGKAVRQGSNHVDLIHFETSRSVISILNEFLKQRCDVETF